MLFGVSMVVGDGVLTPAISVLSAVSGLQVRATSLQQGPSCYCLHCNSRPLCFTALWYRESGFHLCTRGYRLVTLHRHSWHLQCHCVEPKSVPCHSSVLYLPVL